MICGPVLTVILWREAKNAGIPYQINRPFLRQCCLPSKPPFPASVVLVGKLHASEMSLYLGRFSTRIPLPAARLFAPGKKTHAYGPPRMTVRPGPDTSP